MTVERRLVMTLWCAGLAAFTSMYAPQGLLPQIARDMGVSQVQVSRMEKRILGQLRQRAQGE